MSRAPLFTTSLCRSGGGAGGATAAPPALDYIGRGTAAFRAGDIVAATHHWSDAIRLCRPIGDVDLAAQALTRRGEVYRLEGYLRDARQRPSEAALANAEQSGDQALIAASERCAGQSRLHDAALGRRRRAAAQPQPRSRAAGCDRHTTLAASENDLGNLYAQAGRAEAAASAYDEAIASAIAARRRQALAATAEVNAARLALRHAAMRPVRPALLARAVDTLAAHPARPTAAGWRWFRPDRRCSRG